MATTKKKRKPNGITRKQPKSKNAVPNLKRLELKKNVFELRASGVPFPTIAENYGVSVSTARNYLERALKEIEIHACETLTHIKVMEDANLQKAKLIAMQIATNTDEVPSVRLQALNTVLRVQERRAKLLGLDAPVTIEADIHAYQHRDIEAELSSVIETIGKRFAGDEIQISLDGIGPVEPVSAVEVVDGQTLENLADRGGPGLRED
jgi:hypothetical protein